MLLSVQKPERLKKIPDITTLARKASLSLGYQSCFECKNQRNWNKIPDSVCFYTTSEFHRLAKISFNARMRKGAKFLSSRISVDTVLDIADKNGEKRENFKRLI